jgi:hypothetical protein
MRIKINVIITFSLLILAWSCHSPEARQQKDGHAGQQDTEITDQQNAERADSMKAEYSREGKEIAEASFKALSGQLKKAMEEGGVRNAVEYCNFMANPLIDSLSRAHQARIRRTSFHARNPGNKPNPKEKDILAFYHTKHNNEEPLAPLVVTYHDGSTVFYAPIVIPGPLCLTCHGDPGKTISSQDYDYIRLLYPDDDAIGYKTGDLRGMWSISLNVEDVIKP